MASIIAKVTRDYIMNLYNTLYPEYQLQHNKGYPTLYHCTFIQQQQCKSPIHRRTFAPIKHNTYDNVTGHIIMNSKSNHNPLNVPIKNGKVTTTNYQQNNDDNDNNKNTNETAK